MWDAIANVVGGFLNRDATKEANAINRENAERNIALQREFAQSGIRWKVDDAKAAGIHPLYALGANTTSFSPVSVGAVADHSMGNAIAAAGQDVSRAMHATRTAPERLAAQQMSKLQLDGLALDNDIKRAEIASKVARLNQQTNPPIPAVGPFTVPEKDKAEARQPLMVEGSRVLTSPGTSPGQAWEDQLGDDIFSPGFLPNLIGMIRENTKDMSFLDILRAIDRKTAIQWPPFSSRK